MNPSQTKKSPTRRPVVGITACSRRIEPHPYHVAQEKYVRAVVTGAEAVPLLVPPLGDELDLESLVHRLDGLLLTGSPSNLEPYHYGGYDADALPPHDPARDATTLPLIRLALGRGVPLLAICRGFQEVNVALGGSLYPKVHAIAGKLDHREDKSRSLDEQYAPAHDLQLAGGGLLSVIAGGDSVKVNSLHNQGVDRLGSGLAVEAVAPDGLVEAFRVEGAEGFALGVQWHPEWRVAENPLSMSIFRAFGDACRGRID